MKNKTTGLLLILSCFASTASAYECSLDTQANEIPFKFSSMSKAKLYSTNSQYQHWVSDPQTDRKLNYDAFYNRNAVLTNKFTEKTIPVFNDKSEFKTIRYYSANVDNCKKVFLRVDTTSSDFDYAFSKYNYQSKKKIDFSRHESRFNIIQKSLYNNFRKNLGGKIYLKPQADKSSLITKDLNTSKILVQPTNRDFVLIKVIDKPFFNNGIELSPYSLLIKHGNNFYIAEANHMKIRLNSKFDSSIRNKFHKDILKEQIRYGMNKYEVQAAWGVPDAERRQVIYLEKGFGQLVRDDYLEDNSKIIKPTKEKALAGVEIDWHYYDRLPANSYLVFDKNGILKEENQVFRLSPDKPPFILNEIINSLN